MFLEKGYTPLEEIKDTKQKIKCIDEDGYLYYSSYDSLRDKRTKRLSRWKKQNPFKPYNMRLYASRHQKECVIISTDEELKESKNKKIKFLCPKCHKVYEKEWYHWFIQKDNCHFCQECSKYESSYEILVKQWLEENNIEYKREYWFEDCRDKRVLPFDFMVNFHNKIVLIEVDGSQHYYESPIFNNLTLEERRNKDNIKTEYCRNNGYTLLRIPFWDFNSDTYIRKLEETFFEMK